LPYRRRRLLVQSPILVDSQAAIGDCQLNGSAPAKGRHEVNIHQQAQVCLHYNQSCCLHFLLGSTTSQQMSDPSHDLVVDQQYDCRGLGKENCWSHRSSRQSISTDICSPSHVLQCQSLCSLRQRQREPNPRLPFLLAWPR
jgi:hypothetical protein